MQRYRKRDMRGPLMASMTRPKMVKCMQNGIYEAADVKSRTVEEYEAKNGVRRWTKKEIAQEYTEDYLAQLFQEANAQLKFTEREYMGRYQDPWVVG